jgi:hypothetical protein
MCPSGGDHVVQSRLPASELSFHGCSIDPIAVTLGYYAVTMHVCISFNDHEFMICCLALGALVTLRVGIFDVAKEPCKTRASASRCSIKAWTQSDQAESQFAASGRSLAFEETANTHIQGLFTENVFVRRERTSIEWTGSPAIHLPEVIFLRLHETDVVKVYCGIRVWRRCVPLACSCLVGRLQGFRFVQEVGAFDGLQWYGLLEKLRKI